jgi:RHS repeat-associated protein
LIKQGTDTVYASADNNFVAVDRMGSVKAAITNNGTSPASTSFLPYGEELSATGNDVIKFATYTRDGSTGLDYADQRFYTSQFGRFMSADRYQSVAKANGSGSWNKYAYSQDDPANRFDATGQFSCSPDDPTCDPDPCYDPESRSVHAACFGPDPGPAPGPAPAPPAQPECFAQLKDRAVNDPTASKVNAVHSFWWVQGYINGQTVQFILSAGPQPGVNSSGQGVSYLDAWAVSGNANGLDNSGQHTDWSSGLSSSICDQVDSMIIAAQQFPQNTILYNPLAAFSFGGPNSNSAAHYFGVAGGFNPTPAPTAYGWYSPLWY